MSYRTHARTLAVLLLLGVLCLGFATSPVRASAVSAGSIQGDVNCSGAADTADSLQILVEVANSVSSVPGCADGAGDVDCDGDDDLDDAMQILRYAASLEVSEVPDCVQVGAYLVPPPTSEELIAAALEAGDITYEQSLLYRAYALFADPRLPAEYQSPVINWDAGTDLFDEIDANQDQISSEVQADLQEYLVRPNDPASIHYDTPESQLAAQGANRAWRTSLVPGTNARVWALGAVNAEQVYIPLVSTVWPLVVSLIGTPNPDQAEDPNTVVNPDSAIDFYFVNPGVDPRFTQCETNPNPKLCLTATDYGMARSAPKFVGNKASGYLVVNAGRIGGDPLSNGNLVDTIAHEMSHLSQYAYDRREPSWLKESTATWVGFKVMKTLGKRPDYAYNLVPDMFQTLGLPLTRPDRNDDLHEYGSWLFFYSASIDLGDNVVKTVWQKAAIPGLDGILAVDEAIPLDDNFPLYALRNWNDDPVPRKYDSFPLGYQPDPIQDKSVSTPGIRELDEPVKNLAAVYYHFKFEPDIKRVTFENFLQGVDNAHVWAMAKIDGQWEQPEDWTDLPQKVYCRNKTSGVVSDLVVIISDSHDTQPLSGIMPRLLAEDIGCVGVEGWAHTTVHIDDGSMDMTYDSGTVPLHFSQRDVQDQPGNIQYDLDPGSMTWTATGTYYGGDCPAQGQAIINFPGGEFAPPALAGGYLNVVGLDGGDFHSVIIAAASTEPAITITCPGDPPAIEHDVPRAGYLLEIISQPNTHIGGDAEYQGQQDLNVGPTTYHFEWELHPLTP